jgi:hypothetical protein
VQSFRTFGLDSALLTENPALKGGALTWTCTTNFRLRRAACRTNYTLRAQKQWRVKSVECRIKRHEASESAGSKRKFALSVIRFTEQLQREGAPTIEIWDIGWRNYRAVCRAKSKADFISKMTTVLEEADESAFWIQLNSALFWHPWSDSHRLGPA